MDDMKKECRAFEFDIRASQSDEHGHFVEGRAIVFGKAYDNGWFTEYIDDGALDNADLKDVRLLVNHDTSMIPLARSRNNNKNSTMQLSVVKGEGLDIRADLDTERNTTAQALYSAADRGDVSGMSFMFTVDGASWEDLDTDHPVRHVTSIRKVFEVSACTWPAYEDTTFAARSKEEALESAEAALESARARAAEEKAEAEAEAAEARRKAKIEELKARLQSIRED